MSAERINAAAKAMEHHADVLQGGLNCADHYHEDSFEFVARLALEAADSTANSGPCLGCGGTGQRYDDALGDWRCGVCPKCEGRGKA